MRGKVISLVPRNPARKRVKQGKDAFRLVSRREEEILRTIYLYRFMTTRDITVLLFSPNSEAYVRKVLSALCGGADEARDQYLYRFQLPHIGRGESTKVFTLGSRGREFLAEVSDLPVSWYFRPRKVKNASYGALVHNLVLTRFLVAAKRFVKHAPAYCLAGMKTGYEISSHLSALQGASLVPDAWLLFERLQEGAHAHFFPVLLEVDRGTEYKERFQEHVRARVAFVRSGAYHQIFGIDGVTIAYATAGETLEQGQRRRRSLCEWTQEVLEELQIGAWAANFRFASIVYEALYSLPLFVAPMWYRPGEGKPVRLFDPS